MNIENITKHIILSQAWRNESKDKVIGKEKKTRQRALKIKEGQVAVIVYTLIYINNV